MVLNLSAEQLELTVKLQQKIAKVINSSPISAIPFSQYMNMALYDPEFGYYNNLLYKFGQHGDFITSPIVSDFFAKCLVNQFIELFNNQVSYNILEIGAGNGQLMLDILTYFSELNFISKNTNLSNANLITSTAKSDIVVPNYYILELSASLAKLQQERLLSKLPHLKNKVFWINELPQDFDGIILANEVLDAQPCEVLKWSNNINYSNSEIFTRHVSLKKTNNLKSDVNQNLQANLEFDYIDIPSTDELLLIGQELLTSNINNNLYRHEYVSEVNLNNRGFVKSISQILSKGCILLIDYGYGASDYYANSKYNGTLRGFFRHHLLDNVLQYAGLVDITASVNFTTIADIAVSNQLDFIGYTTQANFLINCGLLDLLILQKNNCKNDTDYLKVTNQINKLTSINEMGESFKVIGFSKRIDFDNWRGFKTRDLSYLL